MIDIMILSLIPLMGSGDWRTREIADFYIETLTSCMGDPVFLESSLNSLDPEIRRRVRRIYENYWRNDLEGISHYDLPATDKELLTKLLKRVIDSNQFYDILPRVYFEELSKQGMHPRDIREKFQITKNNQSLRMQNGIPRVPNM